MVSRPTRGGSCIFRRDHPSRPKAMICCFFSSFKTFAMSREATYAPAAVNVLDVSSESMAAFQVFSYGRFWLFTEAQTSRSGLDGLPRHLEAWLFISSSQVSDPGAVFQQLHPPLSSFQN